MPSKADDNLRSIIKTHIKGVDWQSIETAMTGGGVPDLNGCSSECGEVWIECKSADAWAVKIRPAQIGWALRRIRNGGRVLLAIRKRHDGGVRKGPACDEFFLFNGSMMPEIAKLGFQSFVPRVHEKGGPAAWDWTAIRWSIFS